MSKMLLYLYREAVVKEVICTAVTSFRQQWVVAEFRDNQ